MVIFCPSLNRTSSFRRTGLQRRHRSAVGSRIAHPPSPIVACRTDDDDAMIMGITNGVGEHRRVKRTAKAHADDLRPVISSQRMPSAMPATEPEPDPDSTLIGMIRACGATPATPMPLSVVCAMVPATWVPCP